MCIRDSHQSDKNGKYGDDDQHFCEDADGGAYRRQRRENEQINAVSYTHLSPRLQGAGLLNLKAASETPVILTGDPDRDGGKTKLSLGELGELEDDKFTIECTARNFSDQDVTYDGVDLSVTTDDVTLGEDGRNYVGGTKNLAIEDYTVVSSADGSGGGSPDTGSNSITVPANGQVTIKVEVTLDTSKIQENKEIFTNGFFVEGFLSLRPSSTDNGNSVPQINIPYSGFCGDWESALSLIHI